MLRFLKRECGVNLRQPCDPHDYGTPAFYAAQMGRSEILVELMLCGVDLRKPCEKYGKDPYFVAELFGKSEALVVVDALVLKWNIKATEIQRIVRGIQDRARVVIVRIRRDAAVRIQSLMRGEVARITTTHGVYWFIPSEEAEVDVFKIPTKKADVKTRQATRHAAATKIEALCRGELVRLKGLV